MFWQNIWRKRSTEEGLFGLNPRTQAILAKKSWWQKLEAAAHIISAIRMQKLMNASALFSLSFYSLQKPNIGKAVAHTENGFSPLDASRIETLSE